MVFCSRSDQGDGFLGNVERAVPRRLSRHKHMERWPRWPSRFRHVRAFAGGILAHVNLGDLGGLAIHLPRRQCNWLWWRGSMEWNGRGAAALERGLLFGAFLFAASGEEKVPTNPAEPQLLSKYSFSCFRRTSLEI